MTKTLVGGADLQPPTLPDGMNLAVYEFIHFLTAAKYQLPTEIIWKAYRLESAWRAQNARAILKSEFNRRKYEGYIGPDGRLTPEAQMPRVSERTFAQWCDWARELPR